MPGILIGAELKFRAYGGSARVLPDTRLSPSVTLTIGIARGVGLGPAPVGLVCLRPRVAGPGSCRGSIQRWNGRIMLELAHDMRQKSATGVARHRPGERETIGSITTRGGPRARSR